jgi:sortase A
MLRRVVRVLGTLMTVAGVLTLGWALLVWQWQDPFTAAYTHWQQGRLSAQLDRKMAEFRPHTKGKSLAATRIAIANEAARYRKSLRAGDALGRITIGAIGLEIVLVQGTDHESLTKGPGHYGGSALPGQGKLIYVAGHRTTYLAPFSHIDALRPGDYVTIELPYGSFKYVVTRHRVVAANDVSVLHSPRHELLILQACHPRFFASHRYLVYARPVSVTLRGGASYAAAADRLALGRR